MEFLCGASTYLMPRIPLFLVIGIALLSITAYSQGTAGIVGTVTDPTGAVAPGAKITITNTETGDALTTDGIHNVYFESAGTAHEWLTWRGCPYDFAPHLFRD